MKREQDVELEVGRCSMYREKPTCLGEKKAFKPSLLLKVWAHKRKKGEQ